MFPLPGRKTSWPDACPEREGWVGDMIEMGEGGRGEGVWDGGEGVWDGGEGVWDGGEGVWDGGEGVWDGGEGVWDGGGVKKG